ncbi:Exodeoxyribonuclease V subunit gamma [Candidatus Electronema halotolerans]
MRISQSNRLEKLLAALCKVLAEPTSSPLAPELVVVQNPGMARWLSQQIALHSGICANISFPLPASFIWSIFAKTLGGLPDLNDFKKEILLWRILNQLESLPEPPPEISSYLHEDRDGGRRFQLAGKIADLFDQYLVFRPEMTLAWEKGQDEHWQARLWRQLTEGGESRHRAGVLERFRLASDKGILRTEALPKRVCIFGINSLAPAYLEVIRRISAHIDIRIFHFSPCQEAWDDIMPERLIALRRQGWRRRRTADLSPYYSSGNPLLASLGGLGREFFKMLMEMNPAAEEEDLYDDPPQDALLDRLQADILELRDRGGEDEERPVLSPADRSIRFHSCHSPMREIQVLHDRLLDLFEADQDLKPADILVMAPDISRYAPAVAGVFGSAEQRLRIPWSIADQPRREEEPVLEGFLGLLQLVSSRCTAPDVAAVLENPVILARFGLTENKVPLLRRMISSAGIRWGLEQNSKKDALHTWEAGLERLLLGCLTGRLDQPWQGIMPISGGLSEGGDWLGSLAEFIRSLQRLKRQTARPLPPAGWAGVFIRLISRFLDNGKREHEEGLLLLRQQIAEFLENCRQADFEQPLSLAVVRRHFQQLLTAPAGGQAFLAGRVTFCNMVPMRSVPFKVIWLLGMNDADFPRSQQPYSFDLMAENRQPGDRNRRDDDRYLFLEALLSARRHFIVSWLGRDQRDNAPRPPSVVVAELRDYINRGWRTADGQPAAEWLTDRHPLQPFSRRCFDGKYPHIASHREEWLPASDTNNAAPAFASRPLPKPEQWARQIDLSQLVRFWRHPVRFFLEQRLNLRTFQTEELLLPESETFLLNELEKYSFAEEILGELRCGRPDCAAPLHRRLAAGGLPGGCFSQFLHQKLKTEAVELAAKVEAQLRQPVEPVEISLTVDGVRLTGKITSLCRCGRVTFRPANLKAKDLLQLWIHHLALLLHQPAKVELCSFHAAKDKMIRLHEVPDPETELIRLIQRFQQGCCEPLHFYPETSWAWAKKAQSPREAMAEARKKWHSGYLPGEQEDPAYQLGLRGHAPLDDQQFAELAALLLPLLEGMENVKME